MNELDFERGITSQKLTAPVRTIRAASPESLPPAKAERDREYCRPYGDDRQDSRVARPFPDGPWKPRWKFALDANFPPAHLLEGGDRILVQSGDWKLLDRAGNLIGRNRAAGGPMIMDPAHGLFYGINPDAYFIAYRLTDAAPAFKFLPNFGDQFTRVYLARHGTRVLIAGTERALDPHGVRKPSRSVIEMQDLGAQPAASDLGFLTNSVDLGYLQIPIPRIVAAASGELIAAARPGCLYILNWDLQPEAAIEGHFDPGAISLDEAGRIYLAVEEGQRSYLWVLKPSGERLLRFEFPENTAAIHTPAIVGYDHTAYVIAGQQIFAIGADGRQRWTKTMAGPVAGAVVTTDGFLLVAAGSAFEAYDAKGERKTALSFPGETLLTPPLLASTGDLLVASKANVYCLTAK